MKNTTRFIPGFHLQTLRRKPRSEAQKRAQLKQKIMQHSLLDLSQCFNCFIPSTIFKQPQSGSFSRRRLFSKENTFWAFFSQVLDADSGCREVIRKIQAYVATQEQSAPSSSTSAYCQARSKLDRQSLEQIVTHTGKQLQHRGPDLGWKGRNVIVVDGTGISMPDTPQNQAEWPQSSRQAQGCGFPVAYVCACFCLYSGALLSSRTGHRKTSELALFRQQLDTFSTGDIMLGDKMFCSYYDVFQLHQRGVDAVFTLGVRKPIASANAVKRLGEDDLLIQWPKPRWTNKASYSRAEWEALPDYLALRQIKVTIPQPGFRTQSYYLISTLTDPLHYSADDLADLYYQRWDVELFFRDIKITMGMDILRCRTPEMVKKEMLMHWIVYNCIRLLMFEAATQCNEKPRRLSFKASMQALRQWEPELSRSGLTTQQRQRLIDSLRAAIGDTKLIDRPGRTEPRCIKRRPKNFQRLTRPRHKMLETPHRGKYRAEAA